MDLQDQLDQKDHMVNEDPMENKDHSGKKANRYAFDINFFSFCIKEKTEKSYFDLEMILNYLNE